MKSYHLQQHVRYCAEWSKSDRERQMPDDFIYIWNLKKYKQVGQKQTHGYREQFDICWMGGCQGKSDKGGQD